MKHLSIRIAGRCIGFEYPSSLQAQIQNSYRLFFTQDTPEFSIHTEIADNAGIPEEKRGTAVVSDNILTVIDDHAIGTLDCVTGKALLKVDTANFLSSLGTFLRNAMVFLLMVRDRGIALHAAGIFSNGGVYVFVGPSGAGKSTVAQCSLGKVVLDDELILIRKTRDQFMVFPTPCWETRQSGLRQNSPYAIKGIFTLYKDKRVYLEKRPLPYFLAGVYAVPSLAKDLLCHDDLLQRFIELLTQVPCYDLHFLPDEGFWSCIKENYA